MEWLPSMFSFLGTTSGIVIIIVLVVLLVTLGILGKVNVKFGKNIITFGKIAKRSCGDCILLLMSKRERLDSQRNFVSSRILKEQMNFAEQKIIEVQNTLLTSYRDILNKKSNGITGPDENKQYRLYQGILSSAFMAIKDEIRRSFKENGFEHLSGAEFSTFVRAKLGALIAIGKSHINDLYPYEGMLVTVDNRMKNLDAMTSKLEDVCFDLFIKAKDIKTDAKKKVESLEKDFSKEIDEFLQVRQ